MTTTDDPARAARRHQREELNSIIDLLESLSDQQQLSETILSAAAIVGVKITEKTKTSPRGSFRPSPKRRY